MSDDSIQQHVGGTTLADSDPQGLVRESYVHYASPE